MQIVPWKSYVINYLLADRKQRWFSQAAHDQINKSWQLRNSGNLSQWTETTSCLPKYDGSEWTYKVFETWLKILKRKSFQSQVTTINLLDKAAKEFGTGRSTSLTA